MEVTIQKGRRVLRVTEKVFRVIYADQGYRVVDAPPAPTRGKKKGKKDDSCVRAQ